MGKLKDKLVGIRKRVFPGGTLEKQLKQMQFNLRADRLWDKILTETSPGVTTEPYGNQEIIVSLASYGRRLRTVALTIETLMHQTLPPNRIILNIDPQPSDFRLPIALQRLQKRGLEIYELNEEIRSYKKLIPTMERFPEALIITVDDDLLFRPDLVERLYDAHLANPEAICAMRTHALTFNSKQAPNPYAEWQLETSPVKTGWNLFPTHGAGALFPPGCFGPEAFDRQLFMQLCPTADDVWFHAMALHHGTPIVKAESHTASGTDYDEDCSTEDMGLLNENLLHSNGNDRQLHAVWCHFGLTLKPQT